MKSYIFLTCLSFLILGSEARLRGGKHDETRFVTPGSLPNADSHRASRFLKMGGGSSSSSSKGMGMGSSSDDDDDADLAILSFAQFSGVPAVVPDPSFPDENDIGTMYLLQNFLFGFQDEYGTNLTDVAGFVGGVCTRLTSAVSNATAEIPGLLHCDTTVYLTENSTGFFGQFSATGILDEDFGGSLSVTGTADGLIAEGFSAGQLFVNFTDFFVYYVLALV